MVIVDEYFHDLMKKILNSYDIIKNLGDSKEDFLILDVELSKINGSVSYTHLTLPTILRV